MGGCVLCGEDARGIRYFCPKCENPNKWSLIIDDIRRTLMSAYSYKILINEILSILQRYPFDGRIICKVLPELQMFKMTKDRVRKIITEPIFVQFRANIVITFLLSTRDLLSKDIRVMIAKRIYNETNEVWFTRKDQRWKITKDLEVH
jgi:hypothetical protein